jgi:hypothetical protein
VSEWKERGGESLEIGEETSGVEWSGVDEDE